MKTAEFDTRKFEAMKFEAKEGDEARDAEETLSSQMVGAYN